jgi:hypothetical protein
MKSKNMTLLRRGFEIKSSEFSLFLTYYLDDYRGRRHCKFRLNNFSLKSHCGRYKLSDIIRIIKYGYAI